jgi:hypothetical protein
VGSISGERALPQNLSESIKPPTLTHPLVSLLFCEWPEIGFYKTPQWHRNLADAFGTDEAPVRAEKVHFLAARRITHSAQIKKIF